MESPQLETDNEVEEEVLSRLRLSSVPELLEKFGVEEYVIFALMLLVSLFIGVYFAWKGQKSNEDFFMGGRSMGTFPATMSLIVSFMSAITLLGTPAEIYRFGTQYTVMILSYPLVMAAAAHLYLPVFWKLQVSTSYEYLEWRFNKWVRLFASASFTVQMILYMAIVVYAPSLALAQITGFNEDISCVVIYIVCIAYTTIGGMKAVMWTDAFQGLVMIASFLVVIIKGNADAGGSYKVFDRNYQSGRVQLFEFNPSMTVRHTVWTMIVGGYFTWVSIYGINQTQVQRYLSLKTKKQAVKAIWWNVVGIGGLLILCSYAGLVIFSFYDVVGCDPIQSKMVEKADQLFPLFVMQVMGDIPCIPGLFVAGVFSGALSTVSSGLNSLAATTLQDFLLGAFTFSLTERHKVLISKSLALVYGVISYSLIFLVKYLPGVLEAALGIFGMVGGPVLGAFTLGMFVPWANSKGTFMACLISLVFTLWMGLGQTVAMFNKTYVVPLMPTTVEGCPSNIFNATDTTTPTPLPETASSFHHLPIYEVSYMWFSAVACMMSVVLGIIFSFLTGFQDPQTLNPDCISPALPKLFSFWPKFVKDKLSFETIGIKFVPGRKEVKLKEEQISHLETASESETTQQPSSIFSVLGKGKKGRLSLSRASSSSTNVGVENKGVEMMEP